MPRKIQKLLEEGLPAQIYFLCYLKPETGYSLGRILYKVKKGIPPTAKIYPRLRELVGKRYLEKQDNKYYSGKIEPLLSEIEKTCTLDIPNSKKLADLLNSNEFKKYVAGFYENFEKNVDVIYNTHTVKIKQSFNALKTILETLGMICTLFIVRKEWRKTKTKEDVESFEYKLRSNQIPEDSIQKQVNAINYFNLILPYLQTLSSNAKLELTKLWPPSVSILNYEKESFIGTMRKAK